MGKTSSSLGPGGAEETGGLNYASQSSKCWQTLSPPFTALSGRGWALRCHSRLATGWGCLEGARLGRATLRVADPESMATHSERARPEL